MITHKQYPNHHIFETEIGGRTFTVENGCRPPKRRRV